MIGSFNKDVKKSTKCFYVRLANYDVISTYRDILVKEFKHIKEKDNFVIYNINNVVLKWDLTNRFIQSFKDLYSTSNDDMLNTIKHYVKENDMLLSSIILVEDDVSIVKDFILSDTMIRIMYVEAHKSFNMPYGSLIFKVILSKAHTLPNGFIDCKKIDRFDAFDGFYKVIQHFINIICGFSIDCYDIKDIKDKLDQCVAELQLISKAKKKDNDDDSIIVLLIICLVGGLIYGAYRGISYLMSLFF